MSPEHAWPSYFSDILIVGNPASNVGVCTLWAVRETIANGLDKNSYAIVGNMFYNEGISYLIRNVFLNPKIRYIVLCGKDIAKSGDAFLQFMKHGVDENHMIAGTKIPIHKEIPRDALETFRKNVTVINMIGVVDPHEISETIKTIKPLAAFSEARGFPLPTIEAVERFPSYNSGYVFRDRTIAQTWLKIVRNIMKFGCFKKSEHSSNMREVLNIVAVVEGEDPGNPYVPEYLPISKDDIQNYLPLLMTADVPAGTQYTYGNRLRAHRIAHDQIKSIIDQLAAHDFSRRAIAVLWDHAIDFGGNNAPCLMLLQCIVQDKKLFLIAFIRSNDMFAAWPLNAFGLRTIQYEVAHTLHLDVGSLTTISSSAHIYEHDFVKAAEMLKKFDTIFPGIEYDPRGNFRIGIDREKKELVAEHCSPDGKKIQEFRGKAAIELYKKLAHTEAASVAEHWADLGVELGKAELALTHGLKYEQDRPAQLDTSAKTQ
ncbi:MAG: hypothetical protein HY832_01850 [Candidatus Aenigmarchaeota archaeon]|nr:hypothetical protein [Candidatus Aenigmarchaeota archaeon]